MAGRTFKLKDASSTGYGTLTESTATAGTMGSGWTVGTTTAPAFSTMLYGTIRAANTFTTSPDALSTQANFATGQAWRTDIPIHGTFTSGTNWSLGFSMIAVGSAASQTGKIHARIWKSTDPVGATANQTQLTIATAAGFLVGTTAAPTKTTASTSTVTWTPTGIAAFNNEYLFVSTEWVIVGVASRAAADAIFVATAASAIITSDFTPATTTAGRVDSLTFVEGPTARTISRSTRTDSLVLVDTRTASGLFKATASDTLIFVEASTAAKIAHGTGSDSLTFVEARTALRNTVSTASDSISLTDSSTSIRTTKATATELFALLDNYSSTVRTQIFVSDSLTPSDGFSFVAGGPVTVTGTVNDTISLIDSVDFIQPVPVNIVRPSVSGMQFVGNTLFGNIGVWKDATSYSYQWFQTLTDGSGNPLTDNNGNPLGVAISGATGINYTLTSSDNNELIFLEVTATNISGSSFADSIPIAVAIESGRICIPFINPPISLGISALAEIPCVPIAVPSNVSDTINLNDITDATVISASAADTHDGGFVKKKKKKKKKDLRFEEEVEGREKLRKQITEVIHPPIVPPLEPEEPQPVEVEPKPLTPLKSLETPITDYADLARQEIVDKIRLDAELKAKEAAEALQRKIQEEIEDEDELEMILEALL